MVDPADLVLSTYTGLLHFALGRGAGVCNIRDCCRIAMQSMLSSSGTGKKNVHSNLQYAKCNSVP